MFVRVNYSRYAEDAPEARELIKLLKDHGYVVDYVSVDGDNDEQYLDRLSQMRGCRQYRCMVPGCDRVGDKLAHPGSPEPYRCPEHR